MNQLQFQVAVGTIAVTWNSQGKLTTLDWYENRKKLSSQPARSVFDDLVCPEWRDKLGIPQDLIQLFVRLRDYFQGGEPMGSFPWELLDQSNWSEFQKKVYRVLVMIPHGETRTYAWIAQRVSNLHENMVSPQAVGQALKKNPFPILIPCHRVVSANALGGFMGSVDPHLPVLRLKRWLIEMESAYISPTFSFLATHRDLDFSGDHQGIWAEGAFG